MAINISPGTSLSHAATFVSSGSFVPPINSTIAFVSVHSATGGGGGANGNGTGGAGGDGIVSGAFVRLVPGGLHQVTIGAAGSGGAAGAPQANNPGGSGTAGGTTSFDGAITANGSNAGTGGGPGNGSAGNASTASATTTLTALSPAGALIRTGTLTTQSTGAFAGGSAGNRIRYTGNGGGSGSSGLVHIYI